MLSNNKSTRRSQPTMQDIANMVGVDRSVVSRALNNDPALHIQPDTRKRILTAAQSIGYQPNAMARGLRLAKTQTIGLVLPDLTNPVYDQIVRGAQSRAEQSGYIIVVGSAHDGEATEAAFARLLMQRRVDGLLIASATLEDEYVRKLAASPAPVALINRRVAGVESSVILDDAAGSRIATEYLLGIGHRHLGHITGPSHVDTSVRRCQGFQEAATRAQEAIVVTAEGTEARDGYLGTIALFQKSPHITAIYLASMRAAVGALYAAHELGYRVPFDLSVIALHDDPLVEYIQPPLTTVAMPMEELGAAGVDLLLDKIQGLPVKELTLPISPRLVVRHSTAPPPAHRAR